MKNKYGLSRFCLHCNSEFTTRPRFLDYCSQKCKNPLNRGEYDPWNKGLKLTEEGHIEDKSILKINYYKIDNESIDSLFEKF